VSRSGVLFFSAIQEEVVLRETAGYAEGLIDRGDLAS